MWTPTNDSGDTGVGPLNCASTSPAMSSSMSNCSLLALAGNSASARQAALLSNICQRLVDNDMVSLELAVSRSPYNQRNRNRGGSPGGSNSSNAAHNNYLAIQQQLQQHRRGILLMEEGARLSCKQVKQLCKALKSNRSVQHASVGPKAVLTLRHLWMILESIASIPTLTSMQLDLQTWIPEGMLRRILLTCAAQASLRSLRITLTRVSSDHMPTTPTSSSKPVADYSSPSSSGFFMMPSQSWFFCPFFPGSGVSSVGEMGGGGLGAAIGFGGSVGGGNSGVISMLGGGSGMCSRPGPSSRSARHEYYYPQEVRMGNVFCTATKFLHHLSSLKLEYCGIRDEDVIQVCKHLVKHDISLKEWSLVGNRKLTSRAVQAIFPSTNTGARQRKFLLKRKVCHPKILRLDLTDCDLTKDQLRLMVKGLQQYQDEEGDISSSVQELVVAWNHRLGNNRWEDHDDLNDYIDSSDEEDDDFESDNEQSYILQDLVHLFQARKLLDVSCCGVGTSEMNRIFPMLHDDVAYNHSALALRKSDVAKATAASAKHDSGSSIPRTISGVQRLESLCLRGSRNFPAPGPALRDLLRNNSTLKHLQLLRTDAAYLLEDDDGDLLDCIVKGLERNYSLETMTMALPPPLDRDENTHPSIVQRHERLCDSWQQIQMFLALNRAGRRRILAPDSYIPTTTVTGISHPSACTFQDSASVTDWADVLANVSDRIDCLYWLLRHGDPGSLFQ